MTHLSPGPELQSLEQRTSNKMSPMKLPALVPAFAAALLGVVAFAAPAARSTNRCSGRVSGRFRYTRRCSIRPAGSCPTSSKRTSPFSTTASRRRSAFSNEPQPFTAVVMLDTSASMTDHLKLLNQAAEQFLMRLLPVDRAQVGAFNDKLQLPAVHQRPRRADRGARRPLVRQLHAAVGRLAFSLDALKGVDGRRVVLVFTDGDDTPAA